MPESMRREPLHSADWCEEVAARYRDREGVHIPSDLASEMFHAVGALSASGFDNDHLTEMFRTRRQIIVTMLHVYRTLVPEVLALTHSAIPLVDRLLISDARLVSNIERSKQLRAARNLIATSQRKKVQLKAQRGKAAGRGGTKTAVG